jgi:Spy/CpxP family protein refolding chaperone
MKILCSTGLVLALAGGAFAQQGVFPQALQTYLGLTDSQAGAIAGLNSAYLEFTSGKQTRIYQVQSEITALTAADPLDSAALGVRYAEIEAINRDIRDKLVDLRGNTAKVLTTAQQPKLQALAAAADLLPMASVATCEGLLAGTTAASVVSAVLSSTSTTTTTTSGTVYGCLIAVASERIAIFDSTGQMKTFLTLTDPQESAMGTLTGAYRTFTGEKQSRIAQVRTEIASLIDSDVLDPLAIGNGYAEIEAINRDLRDKWNDLRAGLQQVLTVVQMAKLQTLSDAVALQTTISQAQCENLVVPSSNPFYGYAGVPTAIMRAGDFSQLTPACGN